MKKNNNYFPAFRPLTTSVLLCVFACMQIASAQNETIVPMDKESYHVPAYTNQYATVFVIDIPGGRTSNYHTHTNDQACVVLEDYPPEAFSQPLGGPPGKPRAAARGEVSYVSYFGKPLTHQAVNRGTLSQHSICAVLRSPKPYGFKPAAREAAAYEQVLDNERVRAWRLVLQPGQSAPAITQSAPGLRVGIRSGELAEIQSDKHERGMVVRQGQFYWQDAGATRAVRNIGKTPLELIEFEFK